MADKPVQDFGKRGRVSVPGAPRNVPPPPTKRSGNVALLLMGTVAVGGVAYTMMPSRNCEQNAYATSPQSREECTSRSSSSSGHGGSGGSWRSNSSGGSDSSSSSSSSGHSSSVAAVPVVARSGFGSFGHAIGFSGG
jgi:hypothetical protein